MKPKLVYIDHSFHQKTKSTDFLRDILSKNFEIIDIWDNSWKGEKNLTVDFINSQGFDYILFFQVLLPVSELKKIKAKLIWVPMYDSIVGKGESFWMELSTVSIKIISFSRKISEIAEKNAINAMSVQYFFNPENFGKVEDYSGKRIFFWQRMKFSFEDVKKIIGDQKIDQCILKLDPDPGYEAVFPSKEDIEKYNIKIIQSTLLKDKYLNLLKESNIFISPRRFEGIGMSFIEAMSMGMAVVAIDNPTMNEYINNENGYLFDSKKVREIGLVSFQQKGINARRTCKQGYSRWKADQKMVSNFIRSKFKNHSEINCATFLFLKIGQFINKIIQDFKNYFKIDRY